MVSEREPLAFSRVGKLYANSCLRELIREGWAFSSCCFWVLENGLRLVLRLVWNPSLEQELQLK